MALSGDVEIAARQLSQLQIALSGAATHEELCDKALAHYQEISDKACCWNSTVVHAIEFYKQNWKPTSSTDAT